jgi:hypothetical protein
VCFAGHCFCEGQLILRWTMSQLILVFMYGETCVFVQQYLPKVLCHVMYKLATRIIIDILYKKKTYSSSCPICT